MYKENSGRSKKAGKMLNPNQLTQTMTASFSALQPDLVVKLKVKHQIDNLKKKLQLSFDFKPKMAPIINPNETMRQVKMIWFTERPSNARSIFLRKQAALIYSFTVLSSRRWIDICRLKWTDIRWIQKDHGVFLLIRIHISKSNTGEKIEEVSLAAQPGCWSCPIKLLTKFWMMQNKPKTGFIFPCLNKWENGTCDGHRKVPCLGHQNGDSVKDVIGRIAKNNNWEISPTKHTGRRTGIALASLNDFPRERIIEMTGWVNNTNMLRHYTASTQAARADGISNLLAKEFGKEKPFNLFDSLVLQ